MQQNSGPTTPEPMKVAIHKGYMPDLMREDIGRLGGLRLAHNIIRHSGYYWPVYGQEAFNAETITGTPLAGFSCQSTESSTLHNFIGTDSALYAFSNSTMVDITRVSDPYDGTFWNFQTYGDWLIATNYSDPIQVLKGISLGINGTDFINLPGTTSPVLQAKYMCLNHGHLVLGNILEGTTEEPKKVRWSARENVESWTASSSTGADSQEFPEMDGIITGLANVGADFAVLAENSITIGYYIGGQYTFGFRHNIYKNIGCMYPRSVISVGDACYFWSTMSIIQLTANGWNDIGAMVKTTLLADLDAAQDEKINTTYDSIKSIIYWHYPTNGSSGIPDKVLAYNVQEGVFTTMDIKGYFVMRGQESAVTIDSVDTEIDSFNTPMNATDSTYWNGNTATLMVCGADKNMKTLTGEPMTASIETGEVNGGDSIVSVTKIYVPLENTSAVGTVAITGRKSTMSTDVITIVRPIRQNASVDIRMTNRRFSMILSLSTFARLGNEITCDVIPSGGR